MLNVLYILLTVRTMLLALIGFMPTDGLGTIGSLECEPQERRRLAQRCGWVGTCNHNCVISSVSMVTGH